VSCGLSRGRIMFGLGLVSRAIYNREAGRLVDAT